MLLNPFLNDKFWTILKWKESLQTTISDFDENGSKSSKRVENTVGKGKIVRDEQFLLFPQSFQNTCTADT